MIKEESPKPDTTSSASPYLATTPHPESEIENGEAEPDTSLFIPDADKQVTIYRPTTKNDYTWQQQGGFGQLVQVQEREKAMKAGLKFLYELETAMKLHLANVPSASKWLDRISEFYFAPLRHVPNISRDMSLYFFTNDSHRAHQSQP